ncbi:sodium calcium [Colletotrichum karsti]|uniref:Sodium calcium n=1 Tax=Colletotrichum karsti TaxID=1095194 RepID=A0A9P6IB08_9PEZI|nr:sodium calcium [Colletotrichum karsti]KAF9875335.1 sodium calcium [Colletotrichum karsti]
MLSSWLNLLLVFVPVGVWLFLSQVSPILIFVFNGIAIIPLSSLLTGATEKIASDVGDTVGALLNISLGNLVELILFVALKHNHIHIVQASILGSMLVNLLLILGTALCVNGLWHDDPVLNTIETQLLSCLLFVSTAFDYTASQAGDGDDAVLTMGRLSALMVFFIYIMYLMYEIRAHSIAGSYQAAPTNSFDLESLPETPTISREHTCTGTHLDEEAILSSRTIRFADGGRRDRDSEVNDGDNGRPKLGDDQVSVSESEDDEEEDEFRGRNAGKQLQFDRRVGCQDPSTRPRRQSIENNNRAVRRSLSRDVSAASAEHRRLVGSSLPSLHILRRRRNSTDSAHARESHREKSLVERLVPIFVLIISSGLMSMCAEFLVSAIDEVTHEGHLSESVIGLIILPVIGNVAEYVTVVTVAARGKLDLAIAVAVGSSIQIALCVAPLTVIAGWILSRDLALNFSLFEMAALMGTALLVNLLILSDGNGVLRTSGLKGGLMCVCYMIIGVGAYLAPQMEV